MHNYAKKVNTDEPQSASLKPYNCTIVRGGSMDSKEIRKVLAKNVYKLMKALDINAAEISKRSGKTVAPRSVGYILSEERSIGIDSIAGLAKAFRVQPATLLTELSDNDVEHLRLIATLSDDEKEDVTKYANFLIGKRTPPSSH